MTKVKVILVSTVAVVLMSAGTASAQLCVNVAGSCNHYFFGVASTSAPDLLDISGFEYGCSASRTRHASGVIRVVGGRLEIEFTGTNRQFDFTQSVNWHGEVSIANLTGDYEVQYTYLSGGVLTAHGASSGITVTGCAEPAAASTSARDASQPE